MQIPADLGDNATYEDYLEEAKLAAFYAAEDTDEQIVQLLVRDEDFMINQQGWSLDINEAIRIVKELRAYETE
jgi:hypothetical protein|tara:strand:+ start:85 stop:303 length:219 start_codon:yes stop_codon:yes gene_type:complete